MPAPAPPLRLALLGLGRLGRTLQALLPARGYALSTWRRGEAMPDCDVAWITVSDGAVAEVARALPVGPIVLHASGALGVEVLAPHVRAGSLHPLQSFPGPERATPPLEGVPAAIAGHPDAVAVARELALALGMAPFLVPGDRRLYHAAAVMAGNFATTLLGAAAQALEAAGVPADQAPRLLAPLALASLTQAAAVGPAQALTGPFARGDAGVISAHLEALDAAAPPLAELYRVLGKHTAELAGDGGLSGELVAALDRALLLHRQEK